MRDCPRLWTLSLLGAALLWASFPPLNLWPLAWFAPIPWLLLIRRAKLEGRHPYRVVWLGAFCFWLAVLYWLTLPHWATSFGWLLLSLALALFTTAFVGLSRVAVHRLGVPLVLAAPMVWTGFELFRAHFLSGFGMAALAHTQYRWLAVIQISDLVGAYGVGFVVVFVAASLACVFPCEEQATRSVPLLGTSSVVHNPTDRHSLFQAVAHIGKKSFLPLLSAAAVLVAVLSYGYWRMEPTADNAGPRIALIQGSIDVTMQYDPGMKNRMFQEYFGLSEEAVKKDPKLDLMVWPESMFSEHLILSDSNPKWLPEFGETEAKLREWLQECNRRNQQGQTLKARAARKLGVPLLLGLSTEYYGAEGPRGYNSAAYIARDGRLLGVYHKIHLVPFGEYVPMADRFPWLQRLTPLPISSMPGEGGVAFDLAWGDGRVCRFAPNICYESVLPHVIRRQVNQLAAEGREPDFLVNVTNDGWFWGSTALDLHLACGVFRAVECRKPFLIAANTGISAWIDADGRLRAQGPRRATDVLLAQPALNARPSWYLRHGDWFAGACLTATVFFAAVGLRDRWKRKK